MNGALSEATSSTRIKNKQQHHVKAATKMPSKEPKLTSIKLLHTNIQQQQERDETINQLTLKKCCEKRRVSTTKC